jgi:alpha/beta hydrolase family protein
VTTYAQLRTAAPVAWRTVGSAWRQLASVAERRHDEVAGAAERLRRAWRGVAADAAQRRLAELAERLLTGHPLFLAADQAVSELADRVEHAQRVLAAALADTGGAVRVHDDGAVELDRGTRKPDAGDLVVMQRVAAGVDSALRLARRADDEASARLRALAEQAATAGGDATLSPGDAGAMPPPDADPAAVHRWWSGLAAPARRWLLLHRPGWLGRLDGVPVDVRDQANRRLLDVERARLRRLAGTGGTGSALRALDALAARLDSSGPGRAYLLGFDASGDGRAVVALGNPDHSPDVAAYVPGAGADLRHVRSLVDTADRIARRAPQAAVVMWLGYDAPADALAAASPAAARRAEADLDRFTDGLRATHTGAPAHLTLVGHSYGTTVIGYAARDRGLAADDLVLVGSPGVGVSHAADLGVPASHVWASTATWDPIRLTGAARDALRPQPAGGDGGLWYGTDPSGPDFGARTFTSAAGDLAHPVRTHVSYFTDANPSLADIAAIVRGDYGAVR